MNRKNKIVYGVISMFCFMSLIPNFLKGVPVVFLFFVSIYIYVKTKEKNNFPKKDIFILSLPYTILLPSLIYTENLYRIDMTLSARLSLLLLPISMGLLYSSKIKIHKERIPFLFVLGGAIYAIFILFYFLQLGFFTNKIHLNSAVDYLNTEMPLIKQHPIYASIFLGISLLFFLFELLNVQIEKKKKIVLIVFAIPIIVTLLILARKGVLLSLFIITVLLVLYRINNFKLKLTVVGVLLLISVFSWNVPSIKSRFSELFRKSTYTKTDSNNSTSIRVAIYNCAIQKIKQATIIGYGLGDVKNELKKCYKDNKSFSNLEGFYNSHNQYFSYMLAAGLFGLFGLLFFIFKLLHIGIQIHQTSLIFIVLFFAIVMLFENILERQAGLTIFSFLTSFLYFERKV